MIEKWYSSHPLYYLLTPFASIYRIIIFLRRLLFRLGIKKTTRLSVPVIVVGNVTVGGTGKTPLVIYLTELLKTQHFKPGIISRGYGGVAKHYPQPVTADSNPAEVGDEAILLAQRTHCPVVVAPNRVAAAQYLLAHNDCNIILSDDGLQHYALGRDIEIAVIDGQRRFGNGFCLPAGPLREPISRLKQVDFIVNNGVAEPGEYAMVLQPGTPYNLAQSDLQLTAAMKQQTFHAVAAIGNPQRFFNLLRQLGFTIIEHPFPDHHFFKKQELEFDSIGQIIMTEKDAVKCRSFADKRFWCLPVTAKLDDNFAAGILKRLRVS